MNTSMWQLYNSYAFYGSNFDSNGAVMIISAATNTVTVSMTNLLSANTYAADIAISPNGVSEYVADSNGTVFVMNTPAPYPTPAPTPTDTPIATQTPTPTATGTPTVPELSCLAILPLFTSLLLVALSRYRKSPKYSQELS